MFKKQFFCTASDPASPSKFPWGSSYNSHNIDTVRHSPSPPVCLVQSCPLLQPRTPGCPQVAPHHASLSPFVFFLMWKQCLCLHRSRTRCLPCRVENIPVRSKSTESGAGQQYSKVIGCTFACSYVHVVITSFTQGKGRGLVATRNIRAGETVLVEK